MEALEDAPTARRDGKDADGPAPLDVIAGKYLLRRVIGAGGMGTVWAATNLDLDLDVALKVVNPGFHTDETRARLATEGRAEAMVQHRGIVRVFDLGITDRGEPFLVMERLRGRSLGDLLSQVGHLESTEAVKLMLPILEALAFVHERGIVHRDLKPGNIFLAEQRGKIQPMLVDFGIAKLGDIPLDRRQTVGGSVVGSPGYMSPEQARGVDVDHRADIFCASLVLFEAIIGRSAFHGDNYNALLRAVIEQELEPVTAFGRGDMVLGRILQQGLQKNPAERYSSCRELGRELAKWLSSQGETEDLAGEPLSNWWLESREDPEHASTPGNPALRAPASSSSTGALPSLHGMSLSAVGFSPMLPTRTRRALLAALIGLLAAFVVATAFHFSPESDKGGAHAAVATPPPVRATADALTAGAVAPVVLPVEPAPEHRVAKAVVRPKPVPMLAKPKPHPLVKVDRPVAVLPQDSPPAPSATAGHVAEADLKDPYL